MQRKLTLTIDEEVYNGLRAVIGPRKISRFIEELVRPHVVKKDMYDFCVVLCLSYVHYCLCKLYV